MQVSPALPVKKKITQPNLQQYKHSVKDQLTLHVYLIVIEK